MSASVRKLMTEIQQVLKKVDEGVQLFDDIWDRVYSASNQKDKEKQEGELKKEIKKLQRLRDQIKTWIGNSDVKDKTQLTDARRLIETKMEAFRDCERDTKTKAYSKEGLAREAKLDPKEKEKQERKDWANEQIDKLNDLINSLEADSEKIGGGKTNKKQKDQLEKIDVRLKKNTWHVDKLELIIRLLDNDKLEPDAVDSIKEDVEYYVDSSKDDDGSSGIEDEFDIYEELGMDGGDGKVTEEPEAPAPAPAAASKPATAAKQPVVAPASAPTPAAATAIGIPTIGKGATNAKKSTDTLSSIGKAAQPPVKSPGKDLPSSLGDSGAPSISSSDSMSISSSSTNGLSSQLPSSVSEASPVAAPTNSWAQAASTLRGASPSVLGQPGLESPGTIGSGMPKPQQQQGLPASSPNFGSAEENGKLNGMGIGGIGARGAGANGGAPGQQQGTPPNALTPQSSTSPGAQMSSAPSGLSQENMVIAQMLRHSYQCTPESVDMDKQSKTYVAQNPCQTHPTMPQQPLSNSEYSTIFERLPTDALFFAFYHQQDSYQQYLAARQLKQRAWRFHKKYTTWFQRHEEPKVTTDKYEEGTYIYFDYENGWCTRIKEDFVFEFQFLEDD